jgi:predicted peptidase
MFGVNKGYLWTNNGMASYTVLASSGTNTTAHYRWGWLELCLALSVFALLLQLSPDFIRIWREWPRAGWQTQGRFDSSDSHGRAVELQYLIYLPENYDSQQRWPLLLYLHGAGRRSDDINDVAKEGPPYFVIQGKQLPMIVVSPHCRVGESWNCSRLLGLLDHIQKKFAVDPDRVYVSGNSMGGYGTWALAEAAPERFAAAAPLCGGGDFNQVERLTRLPIWAFHGGQDSVVPLEESERMVKAIQAQGGQAHLTVLQNQGHAIEKVVYARDDFYDWLLHQRRPPQ